MSIYGGKELASAFRTVRKNTIQVAQDIPEDKYDFVVAPEVRSVRRMLAHVAISTRIWEEVHKKRLTTLVGLDFFGMMDKFNAEEAKPRSKAEILQLLRTEGEQFAAWMETLTPETLAETVTEPDGNASIGLNRLAESRPPVARSRKQQPLSPSSKQRLHSRRQSDGVPCVLAPTPYNMARQTRRGLWALFCVAHSLSGARFPV